MYKNPAVTIDIIIEKSNKIVLIRRKKDPFKNKLAFPGGFVNYWETAEAAALREAKEETSLDVKLTNILGVYSDPKRDPRKHNITTVFIAKFTKGSLKGRDDASEAIWIAIKNIKPDSLAFDHSKILKDYLKWKKHKGTYWSTKGS